jgi:hypothetical protein
MAGIYQLAGGATDIAAEVENPPGGVTNDFDRSTNPQSESRLCLVTRMVAQLPVPVFVIIRDC